MVQESLEDSVLAKESSQSQSSYEAAATLKEFELKKILIDKECYEGLIKLMISTRLSSPLMGTKSQSKSSRKYVQSMEQEFEVADSDMLQDQEENPGKDDEEPKEKVASKRDWFTKLTQPQEPTNPD
ncbi:hypothetical protein Tco_0381969 [Tanacetum coccineum]